MLPSQSLILPLPLIVLRPELVKAHQSDFTTQTTNDRLRLIELLYEVVERYKGGGEDCELFVLEGEDMRSSESASSSRVKSKRRTMG